MRIGVVALRGEAVAHRVSQTMGYGTSNQAELLAVREALRWARRTNRLISTWTASMSAA